MGNPGLDKIRSLTENDDRNGVYAILDAARNRKIYHALDPDHHRGHAYIFEKENRSKWFPELPWFRGKCHCLYPLKHIPKVLLRASPYLVRLDFESPFADWLFREGWGGNWGIFFASQAKWGDLCRNFQQLLLAAGECGEELYFRYYDPRVFRSYIRSCNRRDLKILFRYAEVYFVEQDDGDLMNVYRNDGGELQRESIELIPSKRPAESMPS